MQLTRSLRTRARWALAWLVLVLAAGVLSPVLAAQRGDFLDSFCTTPTTTSTTSDRDGAFPSDTSAALHHNVLKCPLCWSVSAPPPAPSGALDGLIEPERYTRSRLTACLHALAPGFEPARGPPRV